MIRLTSSGSFSKSEAYLKRMAKGDFYQSLERYGEQGRKALAAATPTRTGLAGASWAYRIERKGRTVGITWYNTNVENGFNVAISLQYGYGTGTGGYVAGRDYINPALKPIFDQIEQAVWREVTRG
jgi:hypothetical protein